MFHMQKAQEEVRWNVSHGCQNIFVPIWYSLKKTHLCKLPKDEFGLWRISCSNTLSKPNWSQENHRQWSFDIKFSVYLKLVLSWTSHHEFWLRQERWATSGNDARNYDGVSQPRSRPRVRFHLRWFWSDVWRINCQNFRKSFSVSTRRILSPHCAKWQRAGISAPRNISKFLPCRITFSNTRRYVVCSVFHCSYPLSNISQVCSYLLKQHISNRSYPLKQHFSTGVSLRRWQWRRKSIGVCSVILQT